MSAPGQPMGPTLPGVKWRKISIGEDSADGSLGFSYEPEIDSSLSKPEMAVRLLRTAAEIEHGLMVEYLFAAMSLKDPDAAALVTGIAVEEMAHLLTIQNLLLAAGAEPYLGRLDQRPDPRFDPFAFRLQPASAGVLACFIAAESPKSVKGWLERYELDRIRRQAYAHLRTLGGYKHGHHLVHRVARVYQRLLAMYEEDGAAGVLTGAPHGMARQASPTEPWAHAGQGRAPLVFQIRDSSDAQAAIEAISAQGEGDLQTSNSHFERLLTLHRGIGRMRWLHKLRTRDRSVMPLHRLEWIWRRLGIFDGSLYDWARQPGATKPAWHRVAINLFNVRYQLLLLRIQAVLDLPSDTPKRGRAIGLLVEEMVLVLQPLATLVSEMGSLEDMRSLFALPNDLPAAEKTERQRQTVKLQQETETLIASPAAVSGGSQISAIADVIGHHDRFSWE